MTRRSVAKLIASALQSLNLPGSIQALERPVGLPPSLLKKAEEVESEGGVRRIQSLLNEVQRLSKSNSKLLSDASPPNLDEPYADMIGNGYPRPRSDRG